MGISGCVSKQLGLGVYRRVARARAKPGETDDTDWYGHTFLGQAAALLFARNPPLGNDFVDAEFSHNRSPLRLKFSGDILNRNAGELESHSLFRVREIVESMRQISIAHKAAGSRSRKIGEGNGVSPGVGLIDKSKYKCVTGPQERIFTI